MRGIRVREIPGRFSSPLHHESVAARLGPWLGTAFAVAFVTGVFSHFTQRPPDCRWCSASPCS